MESLLAADPDDAAYRNLMAAILAHLGEFDRALSLYEGLLGGIPQAAAALAQLWPRPADCRAGGRRRSDAFSSLHRPRSRA